jgi:hypothetical protein
MDRPLDRRRLVAFARDVSLVSEEDYRRLMPPAFLDSFPAALADPGLEFSGIYEDGWIGDSAFFALRQGKDSRTLRITGMIPQITDPAFKTELTVLLDGRPVAKRLLGVGEFTVAVALPSMQGNRRVDLQFSKYQRLPGDDGRPASALLKFVGFGPGDGKT